MRSAVLTRAMTWLALSAMVLTGCSGSEDAASVSSTTQGDSVVTSTAPPTVPSRHAVESSAGCDESIAPGVSLEGLHPQSVPVRPVVFEMAGLATGPGIGERSDYLFLKHPLTVLLDSDEEFTLSVDDPESARLMYTSGAAAEGVAFDEHPDVITLSACGQPVGYAGGFAVVEPSCVLVTVATSAGSSTGGVPVGASCD